MLEDALSFGSAFGHGGNARRAAELSRQQERTKRPSAAPSAGGGCGTPGSRRNKPTVRQMLDDSELPDEMLAQVRGEGVCVCGPRNSSKLTQRAAACATL
eukprot:2112563-Prymnesium_polylepis.2